MFGPGSNPASGTFLGETQRTREEGGQVGSRKRPIPHVQISATSSGAAQTIFTVRSKTMAQVDRLAVVNTSGSAATLTLHAIPSGGTIGVSNLELSAFSIAANTAVDLTSIIGGLYAAGAELKVFAGTTNVLVIHGWVTEIL